MQKADSSRARCLRAIETIIEQNAAYGVTPHRQRLLLEWQRKLDLTDIEPDLPLTQPIHNLRTLRSV